MKHQAYLEFMKNVATDVTERVDRIIQHGFEVLKEDHPTEEEVDAVWHEIQQLHVDVGSQAAEAAREEMKERILEYHRAIGISDEAARAKWDDAAALLEKALRTASRAGRAAWFELTAAVVLAAAAVAVGIGMLVSQNQGRQAAHNQQARQVQDPRPPASPATPPSPGFDPEPQLAQVATVSEVELSSFAVAMAEPPAPLSDSAIAEWPVPVQKVKDEPVEVTVSGNTYQQTVGSVYSSSSTPSTVREALKDHAAKEYEYATMTTHHIYEEKTFKLGSFDGARGTDMGTLKLKLGTGK